MGFRCTAQHNLWVAAIREDSSQITTSCDESRKERNPIQLCFLRELLKDLFRDSRRIEVLPSLLVRFSNFHIQEAQDTADIIASNLSLNRQS